MFALYYRKDIFEDPKMKTAYQGKFKALEPPKTWEDYAQVAQFITDQMAPNVYGAGHFRKAAVLATNMTSYSSSARTKANSSDDLDEGATGVTGWHEDLRNMLAANKASIPETMNSMRLPLGRIFAGQGRHDLFLAADRAHV